MSSDSETRRWRVSGRKYREKRGIQQLSDHTAVREAALGTVPSPAPQRWAAGWGWGEEDRIKGWDRGRGQDTGGFGVNA